MNQESDYIINKFIAGQRLTEDEFALLDHLLNDLHYRQEITEFLENSWRECESAEVNLQFGQIKEKIKISSTKVRMKRMFTFLGKAAAVLSIPLLIATLYYLISQPVSHEMLTIATEKGEVSGIILPDGTKAWLNVDSRLSYPISYGIKSRKIELIGEAYFEVAKNDKIPFEVSSGDMTTKAIGTQFVISAYPESSSIKSSLIEGSVEIFINNNSWMIKPGQQVTLDKSTGKFVFNYFDEDYVLSWKNDQLIFQLTPFDEVITKLEKWYDINIEYDPAQFKSETLTVRFEKQETLEQVIKVFSKANGFSYVIEGQNIIIKKQKNRKGL